MDDEDDKPDPRRVRMRMLFELSDQDPDEVVQPDDVVQLDPEFCRWGPLLCVVDEVKPWGIRCYANVPGQPGLMYLHAKHGQYVVIGAAQWAARGSDVEQG